MLILVLANLRLRDMLTNLINMKSFNLFLSLIFVVFFMSSVSAWNICIDKQSPEAPGELSVDGNVMLSWDGAMDSPESTNDCTFGIEYYNIYLDEVLIGTSSGLSYSGDLLGDGIYIFGVSGVDRAGNVGARAIKEVVFPLSVVVDGGSSSGSSSGSGRSSSGGSSSLSDSGDEGSDDDSVIVLSDEDDFGFSSADFDDGDSSGDGVFSGLTGAVIGGVGNWILALILVLLVFVLFFVVRKRKEEEVVVVEKKKKVVKKK